MVVEVCRAIKTDYSLEHVTAIINDHLLEIVIRNDRSDTLVRRAIKTDYSLEHVTAIINDHFLEIVIRNDRPDIL